MNATQQDYPQDACIQQLVAVQTAASPDRVALIASDQVLSNEELNQHANQLAHYLQVLGVGPNVLVGCCVEPSLGMAVALLGILKADGAYVPLDPTYTPERLSFMLEDARVPMLVTQQYWVTRLPTQRAQVVCLDADAAVPVQQIEGDPISTITPDDLVYVIHTSGGPLQRSFLF